MILDKCIRQTTQDIERSTLSEYAVLSQHTCGREREEEECPIRTPFQRDRDRIIHCKAFRRLKHKTQVFLSPQGDHYRTRLTHTLEVSQIARTIARALRLNEDLTEAIALGHDLGHTPFGHAGERALNLLLPEGFKHNEQSVRVVEHLEKEGQGLNLTYEVRDGIGRHTSGEMPKTLEGRIVRLADRIAYINHDIDDAIRAGVLEESVIPAHLNAVFGNTRSSRIASMVTDVIMNSTDDIRMSPEIERAFWEFHKFMFDYIYTNPVAKSEEGKVQGMLGALYHYFMEKPGYLPEEYQHILRGEGASRAIGDYIAGMTDPYCVQVFADLMIPKAWSRL